MSTPFSVRPPGFSILSRPPLHAPRDANVASRLFLPWLMRGGSLTPVLFSFFRPYRGKRLVSSLVDPTHHQYLPLISPSLNPFPTWPGVKGSCAFPFPTFSRNRSRCPSFRSIFLRGGTHSSCSLDHRSLLGGPPPSSPLGGTDQLVACLILTHSLLFGPARDMG